MKCIKDMEGDCKVLNVRVLFHVYNISGYLIACLEELSKYAEIVVIETPCKGIEKGSLFKQVRWIDRNCIDSPADIDVVLGDFRPDVFFCGGWADKVCVGYARLLHKRGVKTVLLADTPWQAKVRQFIHCLYSRFYLTRIFDYAWVAGAPQERYMRYLGFPINRVRCGYYCADTRKFAPIGVERVKRFSEEGSWPHVFLYVGRYVAVKNMRRMERAFIKAIEQMPETDWKLRCIGSGDLWGERTTHTKIEHLGYKRPDEIQTYLGSAGCFVLPSTYEPWGVVVHEAALMGLPLLCSDKVQAATRFMRPSSDGLGCVNGYLFDPEDESGMTKDFITIMKSDDAKLAHMGQESYKLGIGYTSGDWAGQVMSFL